MLFKKVKYFCASNVSVNVQKKGETKEIKMQRDILEKLDHRLILILASILKIF